MDCCAKSSFHIASFYRRMFKKKKKVVERGEERDAEREGQRLMLTAGADFRWIIS